jgi:CheY-like chemotaxis protein
MLSESPQILVTDDDDQIRGLLCAVLARDGYRLHQAADGGQALEAMRRHPIDLVLLDLMMPNVSGWDVLEARLADESLARIPVIVISACRDPGIADAILAGVTAFVPKPFDLHTLRALVTSTIQNRRVVPNPKPPRLRLR